MGQLNVVHTAVVDSKGILRCERCSLLLRDTPEGEMSSMGFFDSEFAEMASNGVPRIKPDESVIELIGLGAHGMEPENLTPCLFTG